MKTIGIYYHSFSGNTKELSELIANRLTPFFNVVCERIENGKQPSLSHVDFAAVGTFTWGKGDVEKRMKQFYISNIDNLRRVPVYYFGTGDTQFGGDDLFCYALDVLHSKVPSDYPLLRIEQSVRGSQETKAHEWVDGLIKHIKENERWN